VLSLSIPDEKALHIYIYVLFSLQQTDLNNEVTLTQLQTC